MNSVTGFAYVSNPSIGTVGAMIPVGGEPTGLAVDAVTDRVFVTNPPAGSVQCRHRRASEPHLRGQ
ncbi:hypothetical protein [Amycolatopsis sp. cmx-11-51]|uniref:hypothetical protein n=1 Tax=unclassified Amycolatopsis TaxID=2618356 RepID=UPI0039E6C155